MLVLITGGARSGKSSFAERYAARLGQQGVYIATAQAYDDEMKERIKLHQRQREERNFRWSTVEEPLELAQLLESDTSVIQRHDASSSAPVILVDCLTLWLSNWLLRYEQEPDAEERLKEKIDALVAACKQFTASGRHLLLVTNEVGYGLVPEYKLGRQFRDASGIMNQRLAREAEQVFLVTSGIPMELKSHAYRWDE